MANKVPIKTAKDSFVRTGTWEHICTLCCDKESIPYKPENVMKPGAKIVTNVILTCSKCGCQLVN